MAYTVGAKGQLVIAKDIRDRLGVEPGWIALERLIDDHVEIYFVPPEHDRSLLGVLAIHTQRKVAPGEEWAQAREQAWAAAAREQMQPWSA